MRPWPPAGADGAKCAGGLLMQDPRSERYQLGPVLVVLGRRAEEQLGYARALPALESLADATGESVNLGIRSGADVLVVLAVPSRQPLRFDQLAGSRVPIHTSAMGKCLLAFAAPPAAVAAVAVQGPALRLPDDSLEAVAGQVVEAAEAIGPMLGTLS